MDAFFWAALGFLVLSALAGGAFVGLRSWRAWRAFTSLAAAACGGLDELLNGAERLAAHGESTTVRAGELTAALERLRRSRARGLILMGALGEARDLVRAVRRLVPEK